MSSDVKIPDAVMIEAERVNDEIFRIAHDEVHILNHTQRKEAIARALLAAEQRGLERAETVANNLPIGNLIRTNETDPHRLWKYAGSAQAGAIAAAIRSLGEKP